MTGSERVYFCFQDTTQLNRIGLVFLSFSERIVSPLVAVNMKLAGLSVVACLLAAGSALPILQQRGQILPAYICHLILSPDDLQVANELKTM